MVLILTGPFGILVIFAATSIGLLCGYLRVKRSHCIGCLLIPSFLLFSGLNPIFISFFGI
jgi:putative membrane protein